MSQDLFAAFGVPKSECSAYDPRQNPSQDQREYHPDSRNSLSTSAHVVQTDVPGNGLVEPDEDDDWGDFEDASPPAKSQQDTAKPYAPPTSVQNSSASLRPAPSEDPRIGKHPFAAHMDLLFSGDDEEYDAGADDLEDLSKNPEAAMAYSKRIIAEQLDEQLQSEQRPAFHNESKLRDELEPPITAHKTGPPINQPRPPKDPNVLFDADDVTDESEEDDFGDFEDAPASMVSNIDLLRLNDDAFLPSSSMPYNPDIVRQTHPTATPRHIDAPSENPDPWEHGIYTEDEAWDDFDEAEPAPKPSVVDASSATATIVAGASKKTKESQRRDLGDASPPTNIPPPVILLSIFPSILATAREVLLDPLAKLELAERQQLLTHPASIQFLRSYLTAAVVLGHIIAGRKARWKRDQYLAQSMRIGPSSAGGKGGMKLAGLDKTETAKEDREVLDVLRLWKGQVGKLRGTIATASSSKAPAAQGLSSVPEISDPMPIRTLKAVEGGFTAPHACALCGLKREERVAKIDIDINDSFGEWWLDGMSMHLICHDFWMQHKDKLRSR